MSLHESNREDLIREAVALVRRVELEIPGEEESVICGFRRDGSLSVYFGADPVFHFDAAGRLRRAYVGGMLYRTQGTTLAQLKRQRSEAATELLRRDLGEGELAKFLEEMKSRLQPLRSALDMDGAVVVAQVPECESIAGELATALRGILGAELQLAPAIKGKR